MIFSVTACGGGGSGGADPLVGRWLYNKGDVFSLVYEFEFLIDGTGIYAPLFTPGDDRRFSDSPITWRTERDRLYISFPWDDSAYDHNVTNETLTLTYDDGFVAVFEKLYPMTAYDGSYEDGAALLVGRWISEDGRDTVDFLSDGTAISRGAAVTWGAENGRLHMSSLWAGAIVVDYSVSKSTLILTADDGSVDVLRKQ